MTTHDPYATPIWIRWMLYAGITVITASAVIAAVIAPIVGRG